MDGITIRGREYRVECNWRACVAFLKAKGTDSIDGLVNIASLAPSDLSLLAMCCIHEGERLEGRECDLTEDFIDGMPMVEAMAFVSSFVSIYSSQALPKVAADPADKKKD